MGRYELDRKVHKRVGPITYVMVKEDDEDPDLSWLGAYTDARSGQPDYPFYDRGAGCLVVGEREETRQKWELVEITKPEAVKGEPRTVSFYHGVPLRFVQPDELASVEDSQEVIGSNLFRPGLDSREIEKVLAGICDWTMKGDRIYAVVNANEDEDVTVYEAYELGEWREHEVTVWKNGVATKQSDRYQVPRPVDYDPEDAKRAANSREYRFIVGFQYNPANPTGYSDEIAKQVAADYGSVKLAEVAYCLRDAERLQDYGNGWSCVGIIVEARLGEVDEHGKGGILLERSAGLWGIETDSDGSYFDEVADEQMAEISPEMLIKELEAEAKTSKDRAREIRSFLKTMKVKK